MTTFEDSQFEQLLTSEGFSQNPYPVYDRLRAEAPVYYSDAVGAWLLTRYDDVHTTLRDHAHFSSQGRFSGVLNQLEAAERLQFDPLAAHFSVGLIASDPPNHSRLRGLIQKAFTPRVIENLRPQIEALVDEMIDDALRKSDIDLIRDLAFPLPATVIAILLGADPDDRDRFRLWSEGILSFQGTGRVSTDVLARAQEDLLSMREYIAVEMERRREHPGDDLLTLLVQAEEEGDRLSVAEIMTTTVTLLTAGHETTTNLIGNGIYTLLRFPDQLDLLRQQPELMPTAIEEVLRFESPLKRNPRRISEVFELHGQTLQPGDFVLQVLCSANRDADVFTDPDRFDVTRQPNRHLAFAHGIHFCLGAPLARLEGPIAIGKVLDRMPDLALTGEEPIWRTHGLLRGLNALQVTA